MTRDERQEICRVKWIKSKCRGTIEACTGFGKTRCAINCINTVLTKYPNKKVLIVVPTTGLKEQWEKHIDNYNLTFNCEVQVINTVIKHKWKCDLLIIDEAHRAVADQLSQVFKCVKYNLILGLTATIERLDGKEVLLKKYCPVCDTVTLIEAQINGWVSNFTEYMVMLEVPDIEQYKTLNKEFQQHFDFFGYDFNKAMACIGANGYKRRYELSKEMCPNDENKRKELFKSITYHATAFMRTIQARKAFINNHPKKVEIAREIINARPDSKIITFSNSIKTAESIGIGYVYSGKDSKKKGRMTIEEFSKIPSGVLNSSQKANEGLDVPNLSVAIMLGIDSSKIKAIQRVGRVIRAERENKKAEIFNLIIKDSAEEAWFQKAHSKSNYIVIDEQGLKDVLAGKEPQPYKKKLKQFQFRF